MWVLNVGLDPSTSEEHHHYSTVLLGEGVHSDPDERRSPLFPARIGIKKLQLFMKVCIGTFQSTLSQSVLYDLTF